MAPASMCMAPVSMCLVYQRRIQRIIAIESKAVTLVKRHLQEFPLETNQRSESGIVLSLLFYLIFKGENPVKGRLIMSGLQLQEPDAQRSRTH